MHRHTFQVKTVAVIGAGAAGAATAAALQAENYFARIKVFERRETSGGTWVHDAVTGSAEIVTPGKLPPETDKPLDIPDTLPAIRSPNTQNRWSTTPIYNSLTTNVPSIAMSFSDAQFPYGPFVPHYVARQYVENYFAIQRTDTLLEVNTTVEDLSRVALESGGVGEDKWRLTLRKHDTTQQVDIWREEIFDAVVLANGHYSVPYVPFVNGLNEYTKAYPNRVCHSKSYRSPLLYKSKRVVVVGNSASGRDISLELTQVAQKPVYQSRRSRAKWEGDEAPSGIEWKPIIKEFRDDGRIIFTDDTHLDDIDVVLYCTGYKASFPFWNEETNGGPLWDYQSDRIVGSYLHTFFQDFPTLGIVGLPRTLTFRSFEYQAIALARLWSNRAAVPLPHRSQQKAWETQRAERTMAEHKKFHDIPWDTGETAEYLDTLFRFAGLGTLQGDGRVPPVLSAEMIWAIDHILKYPDPDKGEEVQGNRVGGQDETWLLVQSPDKDRLAFI